MNCETDFVARNDQFRKLAADLTRELAKSSRAHTPTTLSHNSRGFTRKIIQQSMIESFNDKISSAILHLGENIKLSRGLQVWFDADTNRDVKLFGYAHATATVHEPIEEVHLGQYGTIIALTENHPHKKGFKVSADSEEDIIDEKPLSQSVSQSQDTFETDNMDDKEDDEESFASPEAVLPTAIPDIGKLLCQHVIGLNPKYMSKSEEDLAKEKERLEQGYKIVDESEFFLSQKLISNEKYTVQQFVNARNICLLDFVRYECGEEIVHE